jgi:integrase
MKLTTTRNKNTALARPTQRANPAAVYVASLAKDGRPTALWHLREIAAIVAPGVPVETFPWHQLRYEHTQAIRTELAARHMAATVNKALSFLRGTLRAAWSMEMMGAEDFYRAISIKRVRGSSVPAGRALSVEELDHVLDACDPEAPLGARDRALVAAMYAAGLRRHEVCALDVGDWDGKVITVRKGKGNKGRLVPVPTDWREPLDAWHGALDPGPLFRRFSVGRRGKAASNPPRLLPARLGKKGVSDALGALSRRAKVEKFSPHDLRRSYGTHLLEAGVDVILVRDLMGHADVSTTARYDRRGDTARAAAVEKLSKKRRRNS